MTVTPAYTTDPGVRTASAAQGTVTRRAMALSAFIQVSVVEHGVEERLGAFVPRRGEDLGWRCLFDDPAAVEDAARRITPAMSAVARNTFLDRFCTDATASDRARLILSL